LNEQNHNRLSRNLRTASFGLFLVLVGIFFILYPLGEESRAFLADLRPALMFDHVYYPAPSSPHPLFYHILRNFSITWGAWLGLFTIVQLAIKDRPRRVAHTLGDCVFWIGAAHLLDRIAALTLTFGSFLALLIVVTGLSLIIRALTLMSLERFRH
jgi:hypothetical protein